MGQGILKLRALAAFLALPIAAFAQGGGSSLQLKQSYIDPPNLKFRLENCDHTFLDQTIILMDHALTPAFFSFDYSPFEYQYSGPPSQPVHHGKPMYRENVIDMISFSGNEAIRSYLKFDSVGQALNMADESLESVLNGAILNVESTKSPGLGVIYRVAEKALYRERMAIQLFKRSADFTSVFKKMKSNREAKLEDPFQDLDETQKKFAEALGPLTDEELAQLSEEVDSSSRVYDGTYGHYRSDASLPTELMYRLRDMDPTAIRFFRNSFPTRQLYEIGAYKVPRLLKKIPNETPERRLLRLKLVMNQYVQKFVHWALIYEKYVLPELDRLKIAEAKYDKKAGELDLAQAQLTKFSSAWASKDFGNKIVTKLVGQVERLANAVKQKMYSKTIDGLKKNVDALKKEVALLLSDVNTSAVFVGHFARNADPILHERELGFQAMQRDPIFMIDPQTGKFLIDAGGNKVPQIDPVTNTQAMETISTVGVEVLAPKLKTLLDNLKAKIKLLDVALKALEQGRPASEDPQPLGDAS